jgi:hypothetical protein
MLSFIIIMFYCAGSEFDTHNFDADEAELNDMAGKWSADDF